MNEYALDNSCLKLPPVGLARMFRHVGPSIILTASIVGSGELIMTTTLGAKAGFVALWVILVSCFFKVTIQLEFGKHAISSGETTMQSFNSLPGPRWKGISWTILVWISIKGLQLIQYGGIVGSVALVMNMAFPGTDVWIWVIIVCLVTYLLVFKGHYRHIERTAILLTAAFSLFTIFCVIALQATPYRVSFSDLGVGLSFKLPAAIIGVALAAFGLTGVSADEIISYPYWCIEKGYARYTGIQESSDEWIGRAKGWIRVMYLDAVISMIIYTIVTAAFYLLGAAILHERGEIPAGYDLIIILSNIYTESTGPWALAVFMVGAVVTLFSTLFVACASGTRMFTDAFARCGFLDFQDPVQRGKWIRNLAWILPLIWAILFLVIKAPVLMVMAGGLSLVLLLVLVVYAAWYFRYRRLKKDLKPGILYDTLLWISFLAITGVGVLSLYNLF